MIQTAISASGPIVLVGAQNGVALIPSPTPLTRLNYFDGKFLRAEDLNREQAYLRSLVQLSNQAGGTGVVHGFTTTLGTGGTVDLSPGLAIDPRGNVLFLPHPASLNIVELIEKSREATGSSTSTGGSPGMGEGAFAPCETASVPPPGVTTTFPTDLYLIALAHAEALCGEEDVYGRLCEAACITSTDRPFRLEGIVVRAIPLALCPPTCDAPWLTSLHRRSQVASAYFATERMLYGRNMSGTRLTLDLWCHGAEAQTGTVVPLAVVSVNGSTVDFLDAWAARRERIEAPPRRYWAWQMMMRPWNVFLAQVLQFQCHLHSVLGEPDTPDGTPDPCEDANAALRQAIALLEEVEQTYATPIDGESTDTFRPAFLTRISDLKEQWSSTLAATDVPSGTRILINGGIIELPPAGYLPVVAGNIDVNTQVRRLLGEGVDLRFCSVRPDYVAHALEEAQHLERICLLQGIENPGQLQEVDILVPDGTIVEKQVPKGLYFETTLSAIVPTLSFTPSNNFVNTTGDLAGSNTAFAGGSASSGGSTGGSTTFSGGPNVLNRAGQPAPALSTVGGVATSPAVRVGPQFRGAGRGEQLTAGGGAFHFAGLLVQTLDQLVGTIDREASKINMKRSSSAERAAGLSGLAGDFGIDLGSLFSRFSTFGSSANAKTANFAGAKTFDSGNFSNYSRAARLKEKRTVAPPALWLTLRSEKNPFSLSVGESTPIKLEGAAGIIYGPLVAGAQLVLDGDLFCDQTNASATGRRVVGRARGWAWLTARAEVGEEVNSFQPSPFFLPLNAELELNPNPGGVGGELVMTIRTQQGHEFSVTTEWDGSPVLAGVSVAIDLIDTMRAIFEDRFEDDPERQEMIDEYIDELEDAHPEYHAVEILRARLQENAAVENENNSHHAAAVKALRTIERALDQDGFFESALQVLFPPAEVVTEKRILPTRDWVLFHRRRVSSCDCCQPERKVIAPPRRYQFYEITAPESVSVEDIQEALASGESIEEFSEIVGVVEFQGGSAQLTADTDVQQILTGWRLANPSDVIIYGGVASEGAAMNDSADLGEERIARLADIVKPITPTSPQALFEELALVPTGLSAQGVDGVIFLITMPDTVATQTHRVLMLSDQGMMDDTLRRISQGELNEVIDNNTIIGVVEFESGTDTVTGNSLDPVVAAWQAQYQTTPVGNWLVVRSTAANVPNSTVESQGAAIVDPLNGQSRVNTVTSAQDVFEGSIAITILEPGSFG